MKLNDLFEMDGGKVLKVWDDLRKAERHLAVLRTQGVEADIREGNFGYEIIVTSAPGGGGKAQGYNSERRM